MDGRAFTKTCQMMIREELLKRGVLDYVARTPFLEALDKPEVYQAVLQGVLDWAGADEPLEFGVKP